MCVCVCVFGAEMGVLVGGVGGERGGGGGGGPTKNDTNNIRMRDA